MTEVLDKVFWALSDATRRDVLRQLGQGGATVTELAAPHGMSLPGFMKHLRVLEDAGLVTRQKEGRVVRCELAAEPMQEAAMWLAYYEKFWTAQLDALGRFLYHEEEVNPWPRAPRKTGPASTSPASTPSRPKKSGGPGPSRKR
ncbi:ArsR/SmtB family transcription factor [Caenimonas soli]|uniref:ArsR/SmtB family transcription factor n=1 Tax=Caenimonas soli TaxID=2735555 RepID=UPI001555D3FD|nr:metalloregulator ArsR/SmtB family transcription factor [Caenimonas soli]NPC54061.1 helix-turn-helix transcriptional regulator [Caenimonas soli]